MLGVTAMLLTGCAPPAPPANGGAGPGTTGVRWLADDGDGGEGFARAYAPRDFAFPRDHGSHPEFRNEWWYFTGNLHDPAGRHFGFELTFFRFGVAASAPTRESAWATADVWMAHLAITDTQGGRFFARERFARGALDLAGATIEPLRIWTKRWSAAGTVGEGGTDITLSAADGDWGLELVLEPLKPPVGHGDRGLDAKGPEPGNASYYYSLTRSSASGSMTVGGRRHEVDGFVWMDREWGTSALSPGIAGWDWFALQLSDGRDLMFYRLRTEGGGTGEFSGGSIVDARGERTPLGAADVELEPRRRWRSPHTGIEYPVEWRLRIPREGIVLDVAPRLDDQELDLSVRYWEGAVSADGRSRGEPLRALGYLELAGY